MYIYSISIFKIHFSGYVDCIGLTGIRYLFQILLHYSISILRFTFLDM